MTDKVWNGMIPPPEEDQIEIALSNVRGRVASQGVQRARRWRSLALAAGLALAFAAGWMAGQATPGVGARWMWALGGHSIEEGRATFVAVPVSNQ